MNDEDKELWMKIGIASKRAKNAQAELDDAHDELIALVKDQPLKVVFIAPVQ